MPPSTKPGFSHRIVQVIDSHTGGEPTRVVLSGGPALGGGPLRERLAYLRQQHDGFRTSVVCEPRGSQAVVGALLCSPDDPTHAAAVIFFNDVGYLGMCGHGTIGLVTTLAYLGRIGSGRHAIQTPVGVVYATLHADGKVTVENVASYRFRSHVEVFVPGVGSLTGDIAWGGNWFFLVRGSSLRLRREDGAALTASATALRNTLEADGIRGEDNAVIDHIEFYGPPEDPTNNARNFVLCPGATFDRSPCGTGTSAKLACLAADGELAPGEIWRQEGILGTVFTASYLPLPADLASQSPDKRPALGTPSGAILPRITGSAYVTAEAHLLFHAHDPFAAGIRF